MNNNLLTDTSLPMLSSLDVPLGLSASIGMWICRSRIVPSLLMSALCLCMCVMPLSARYGPLCSIQTLSDKEILQVYAHPIHLTYTEIHYNTKEQMFEVTLKVFLDDIEAIIKKNRGVELKLASPKEHAQSSDILMQYVMNSMAIEVGGIKLQEARFIGKEYDLEAVWLYFEIPVQNNGQPMLTPGTAPSTVVLRNTILNDMYADQSHIMHCTINGKKRSVLLRKGHESERITY